MQLSLFTKPIAQVFKLVLSLGSISFLSCPSYERGVVPQNPPEILFRVKCCFGVLCPLEIVFVRIRLSFKAGVEGLALFRRQVALPYPAVAVGRADEKIASPLVVSVRPESS